MSGKTGAVKYILFGSLVTMLLGGHLSVCAAEADAASGRSDVVPEAEVPQRLREAAEELTRETAGERYEADDPEYTTALTLTLSGLAEPAALPMHLRADGSLCFVITLYHPGGGTTAEEIALP